MAAKFILIGSGLGGGFARGIFGTARIGRSTTVWPTSGSQERFRSREGAPQGRVRVLIASEWLLTDPV